MGCIEWHVTDKTKPMVDTRLRVVAIILRYPSGLVGRCDWFEHVGMVAFFEAENIMQVVLLQDLNVRGIGTQAVFSDDQFQVRVVLAQLGHQTLGCIAFTIVFIRAILRDNRFGHQRNHCALIGVNESRPQHLVAVGHGAVSLRGF